MITLILLVILILLLGGGGYWTARRGIGEPGLPAIIGLVLIVVFVCWVLGFLLYGTPQAPPP